MKSSVVLIVEGDTTSSELDFGQVLSSVYFNVIEGLLVKCGITQSVAKAPKRNRTVKNILSISWISALWQFAPYEMTNLVTENQCSVRQYLTGVDGSAALKVIVENGRGADRARERNGEFACNERDQ